MVCVDSACEVWALSVARSAQTRTVIDSYTIGSAPLNLRGCFEKNHAGPWTQPISIRQVPAPSEFIEDFINDLIKKYMKEERKKIMKKFKRMKVYMADTFMEKKKKKVKGAKTMCHTCHQSFQRIYIHYRNAEIRRDEGTSDLQCGLE
jgi:hypothetical protein